MKKATKTRNTERAAVAAPPGRTVPSRWALWAVLLLLGLVAIAAYGPALAGPFVFDDLYLPFMAENFGQLPLSHLLSGVRPLLILSFKINYEISGLNPASFHFGNLLLHMAASLLAGWIVHRYLQRVGADALQARWIAVLLGGVYLLHPLQTEAVSYIASRSETLSVLLAYGAWAVYLGAKDEGISFVRAALTLVLYGLAVLTKEHTALLPGVFLLTDAWFRSRSLAGSLRRQWKFYAPALAAAAAGSVFIWKVLKLSDTAGFRLKGVTWLDYFFTQCRAIWAYVRLALLPAGQNLDPEFPLSRNLLEHGAVFGLAGLILWAAAAFHYRNRYPLAALGTLIFFLLLAPTSSFLPIADPMAERRMYLPMIGLLLMAAEFLARWSVAPQRLGLAGALVLAVLAVLTYQRNHVWGSPVALWEDTVSKSPNKSRPHQQLAYAYYAEQRCADAARHYEIAAQLEPPDQALLVNWALAEDCAGNFARALETIQAAIARKPSAHSYATLGMFYGKRGETAKALEALDQAAALDPKFPMTYVYRGSVYLQLSRFREAAEDFGRALRLRPDLEAAARGFEAAQAALQSTGR